MSGNPKGRPKSKVWTETIREAVSEIDQTDKTQRPRLKLLAEALIAAGLAGEVQALKEIGDRLEGKPAQPITGDDESPIVHEIRMVPVSAGR